jgi:hypothetical protein
MIRSRTFFFVLVVAAVVLTIGASVVQADPPANSPWSLETIASITGGDVGQFASIAFSEANGKPYISYYDETNQDLRLIYPHATSGNCGPNNQWYCEAPDTVGDVGQYSSIDYYTDSVGGIYKIGIAYYDATNQTLKAAIWSSDAFPSPGWTVSTIDDGSIPSLNFWVGRYASLKFDSTGAAHIAHTETVSVFGTVTHGIRYAYAVAGGGNCGLGTAAGRWQCDYITGSSTSLDVFVSLDLTTADVPAVVYSDSGSGSLRICVKTGADWPCFSIDSSAGGPVSLAIDQSDLPHIGYYDSDNGTLKYATYVGSGGNCGLNGATYLYQCDVLDTIGEGQSQVGLSLAMDPDDYPVIAYEDASDPMGFSVLNVARPALAHGATVGNCGPIVNLFHRWQCTTIDDATQGGGAGHLYEAAFASVAVDPNGLAAIAYNEIDDYFDEGRLKVAYQVFHDSIFSDDFESGSVAAWTSAVGGP